MQVEALYRDHIERLGRRYGAALEAAGFPALVIHAGRARPHNEFDDQFWPLRPTPAFIHWLPLAEEDSMLVIRPGARPALVRTVAHDFWHGDAELEAPWALDSFEVTEVDDPAKLADHAPAGAAFVGDAVDLASAWGLDANPASLLAALDEVRRIKSDYEVACIAEANRRALRGHAAIERAFTEATDSELALNLRYLEATDQDDSETPYKNIVAIDAHAAVLHHVHYGRTAPGPGSHSLLVDAGATCRGYASDITRTHSTGAGDGVDLFNGLVDQLEALQRTMCERLVAGVDYETLHEQAHQLLAGALIELGIATGDAAELVDTGVTRALLPHGLGHSLGVQVHDVGCRVREPKPENPFLRTTITTEPGMVFTIEPGCYVIDGLLSPLRGSDAGRRVRWSEVETLARFGGVRIEDNVLVTTDGNQNLTRDNEAAEP